MVLDDNRAIAALLATSVISFAPSIILVLFPDFGASSLPLSLGKCLAAGGLLGDVFLHVLPHAASDEEGSMEKVGQLILVGFCVFMIFDMLVRTMNGESGHNHHGLNAKPEQSVKVSKSWWHLFSSSTVLLNLVADSLHNFTDGLAIGASFGSSRHAADASLLSLVKSSGGIASTSVLVHEIPHELGDFSVLMSEGFSKWQAITLQAVTAIAAFMGTIAGLIATQVDGSGDKLMPFTAGGFIYLAAVSILPEILEENGCYKRRICQMIAFLSGIAFLHAVSVLEHAEGCGAHGHHHGYDHDHQHEHHHDHHLENHHHEL